ncbi:sterol desaturase family protein [bacterium]|nr:sterol desaturase family protein [bacterium]
MLRTREDITASPLPRYSFAFHALSVHVLALGAIAGALSFVRGLEPRELAVVPAGFLFANFFEYLFHRVPMHRKTRGLGILFARHTLLHHAYFRSESMRASSTSEMRFVVFPAWAFLVMLALTSPAYVLVGLALGKNVGLIFLATAVSYYLLYEWLHASYHLAPIDALSRIPLLGKAAARHRLRHDPGRMTEVNFNITFPVFDHLVGTAALGGEIRPRAS